MALQHFPMGTWDFPLPFLASSPSRQLLLQACFIHSYKNAA